MPIAWQDVAVLLQTGLSGSACQARATHKFLIRHAKNEFFENTVHWHNPPDSLDAFPYFAALASGQYL